MKNSFGQILKMAETVLKLIGIVVTFEVIAFPAHNLEVVIVKHPLRATSLVQFVIEANVMRVKVDIARSVDDFLTVLIQVLIATRDRFLPIIRAMCRFSMNHFLTTKRTRLLMVFSTILIWANLAKARVINHWIILAGLPHIMNISA